MKTADETSINDWEDDRVHAYLALRYPANDDDEHHLPVLAPANDNDDRYEYGPRGEMVRVRRRRTINPLACDNTFRARPAAPKAVPLTAATIARHRLDVWRATAPANDSDIFSRAPRSDRLKPHPLEGFTGELAWWRTMTGTPAEWTAIMAPAANDHEAADESMATERENEEIRPTIGELVRCFPKPISIVKATNRSGEPIILRRYAEADIEMSRGRIARLGGMRFATATKWLPDEGDDTNVSGAVLAMPWAGTLRSFQPTGRTGWSFPTEHAREHRSRTEGDRNSSYLFLLPGEPRPAREVPEAAPRHPTPDEAVSTDVWLETQGNHGPNAFRTWLKDQNLGAAIPDGARRTVYPVGLPRDKQLKDIFLSGRTVPGAGSKNGAGDFDHVRRADTLPPTSLDLSAERDTVAQFRVAHTDHAAILDAAMTAQNMAGIAAVSGLASPHTGQAMLRSACMALRDFRKNVDDLQFLPTRAA